MIELLQVLSQYAQYGVLGLWTIYNLWTIKKLQERHNNVELRMMELNTRLLNFLERNKNKEKEL